MPSPVCASNKQRIRLNVDLPQFGVGGKLLVFIESSNPLCVGYRMLVLLGPTGALLFCLFSGHLPAPPASVWDALLTLSPVSQSLCRVQLRCHLLLPLQCSSAHIYLCGVAHHTCISGRFVHDGMGDSQWGPGGRGHIWITWEDGWVCRSLSVGATAGLGTTALASQSCGGRGLHPVWCSSLCSVSRPAPHRNHAITYSIFSPFFLAMFTACRGSWARDQTCDSSNQSHSSDNTRSLTR